MDYKALVCAVALEHGHILRSKQEEAILAFLQNQHVFIYLPSYWLLQVTVLLTASSHI